MQEESKSIPYYKLRLYQLEKMENDTVLYTFITKKVFLNSFSHEREEMSSINIKCN